MGNTRLWFFILAAIAVLVFFRMTPEREERSGDPALDEPRRPHTTTRIVADRAFGSYADCDDAAEAAVQDLKDEGISVALASRSVLTEITIYKVYYPGATGQVTCRGARLIHEITEQE